HINDAQLLIFDINGNLVIKKQITQRGYGSMLINAGTLSTGNYIYTLLGDGNVVGSKKLVILE
ncbi:MAG: T9SS type A sorting domain-containing protein, partial [Flavobacteriales bacterium]|nr:T9SS type A sorting domain-containing protein [Flavobacteriales bacterium]